MKRSIIIASLFFCLVMPVAAQKEELKQVYAKWLNGDGFVLNGGYDFDGKYYRLDVKMEDFNGTPKWEPSSRDLPLSPQEAYRIASEELKVIVSDLKPWMVHSIELNKLPGVSDGWFYEVSYSYLGTDRKGSSIHIIVRLDGKAIRPTLTPRPEDKKP